VDLTHPRTSPPITHGKEHPMRGDQWT